MKNKIILLIAINFLLIPTHAHSSAEWTIITYLQTDNNLQNFAEKSVQDMEKVGSTNDVNVLIQWDQPQSKKTWRYKIGKGSRIEDESLHQAMGVHPAQEIIDCMKWVVKKYPAKRYMLVLSSHGNGIVDKKLLSRGILYDETQQTFLTNQGLEEVLKKIKRELGKNIDILGMDACFMGMVEIAYQIKNYADFLVASQNTEPARGWIYSGFLQPLCTLPQIFEAQGLAQSIVQAYENYYKKRNKMFTLSSTKLNTIDTLTTTINQVVFALKTCLKSNQQQTNFLIKTARQETIEFDITDYVDLHSFFAALLQKSKQQRTKDRLNSTYNKNLQELEQALTLAMRTIDNAIHTNTVGTWYTNAHGISIYFPKDAFDDSYPKTNFAKASAWISFLQDYFESSYRTEFPNVKLNI